MLTLELLERDELDDLTTRLDELLDLEELIKLDELLDVDELEPGTDEPVPPHTRPPRLAG